MVIQTEYGAKVFLNPVKAGAFIEQGNLRG